MLIYGAAAFRLNGYKYIKVETKLGWVPRPGTPIANLELARTLIKSPDFTPTEDDINLAKLTRAHINGYLFNMLGGKLPDFLDQLLKALCTEYPLRADLWKFAYMPEQYTRDTMDEKTSDGFATTDNEMLYKLGEIVELSIKVIGCTRYGQYSAITSTNAAVKFFLRSPETINVDNDSGMIKIKAKVKAFEKDKDGTPYTLLSRIDLL